MQLFAASIQKRQRGLRSPGPETAASASAADLQQHFRERYPVLLDGSLPLRGERGHFLRSARESLLRGRTDPGELPAAVLRETLASLGGTRRTPATRAGLTAVGPHDARVWWDASLLDNIDDILASLDRPRPILRFFDVTGLDAAAGRWHESFDVDISLADQGKNVELLRPDREYVVDLGYRYADGRILRLARTNTIIMPRDGRSADTAVSAELSSLRPRPKTPPASLAPDAAAREWLDSRPDHSSRDTDAELFIHMLYQAFLREGPRALRRGALPSPRDPVLLEQEYRDRMLARRRTAPQKRLRKTAPAFLVIRLDDAERELPAEKQASLLPVPAGTLTQLENSGRAAEYAAAAEAVFGAAACALSGRIFTPGPAGPLSGPALVRPAPAAAAAFASLAAPVFEAADSLHRRLSELSAAGKSADGENLSRPAPAARSRDFGGGEARRFARAGVRVTRMALTLEGRMRPGARLKVAGKLVSADADGCFRLECVLAGRRASIPMTAGTSVGGEARSVVTVGWEKRPAREKKPC